MRKTVRKPIAVLLSVIMILSAFGVGFVTPAFAVDTTALDAAVADANALTAADYVDFSGVTAAVNAAADTTGKTQTQIDDMEDAIRIAIAKLELNTKYTPQTIISETAYVEGNVVYVYGAVTMPGAFSGQSATSGFRFYWDGSFCYHTCQTADEVIANYTIDRYKYSNMSQLGEFISLNYGTAGYRHRYNVFLDRIRTDLKEVPGWTFASKGASFTSAKGQTLYYEINKGPGLLTASEHTDYVTGMADISRDYTVGINGALPAAGDSVQFRVVANPMCTTLQDNWWFIGGAYVVVNLSAYDTTALHSAMAFSAAVKSNYTPESYAAYRTALDAATPILNKGNPTQEEIDAATTALNDAISGLQSVITIDGNGGAVSPETLTLTFGRNSTATFPASDVTATRAGYDFSGWDKSTVTFNDTVTAVWTPRHDTAYTINNYYMDADGSYPAAPETQTFIGTTEDVVTAANAASAPAHYSLDTENSDEEITILGDGSAVLNLYYKLDQYTVTFSVDGTETSGDYYYGATPVYSGETPALDGGAQYTYTFLGWTDAPAEPGAAVPFYMTLPAVTGDAAYYPYFGAAVNSYDITFIVDGAETVQFFPYGATPAYNGIPSKDADAQYTYAFSGWSPEIAAVTDEATYTAQFSENLRSYNVSFITLDGTNTISVPFGEVPVPGFVPAKASDDTYNYTFAGWSAEENGDPAALAEVTGEATYYAVFTATPIPQHEHEFTTFVRTVAATCVSGGYDEYVCECGMTEKRNETAADPSNHAKAAITVGARAATEEADGYTGDLICPACGATITGGSVVPKTGGDTPALHEHDFAYVRTVAATCCEKGYDEYACACGMTEKRNETASVDADNHAGVILTVGAREATETQDGYSGDTVCSACGKTLTAGSVIPKTGSGETPAAHTHTFDTFVRHVDADCCTKGYDEYKCACGMTEKRNETASVDANVHAGAILTVGAREATEAQDGYTGDKVCSACGKTVETGTVIPKTGTETPTEPEEPVVYEHGCPICGETHDGNIFEKLLGLVHTFLHLIRTMFRGVKA